MRGVIQSRPSRYRHTVQTLAIRVCGAFVSTSYVESKDGEERVVPQWHGDADLEFAASLRAILSFGLGAFVTGDSFKSTHL